MDKSLRLLILFVALCAAGCRHADRGARDLKTLRQNSTPMSLRDKTTLAPASGTIRLERTGATVTVSPAVRPEDLGVAFYPGAKPVGEQHTLHDQTKSGAMTSHFVTLETTDSPDAAVNFYKKQLGPRATVDVLRADGQPLAILSSDAEDSTFSITIKSEGPATRITILSFKSPQK